MSITRYRLIDLLAAKSTVIDSSSYFDVESADEGAERIGSNTRIWKHCHVRKGARIGDHCVLGMGVYVDVNVVIGNGCKIQNHVSLCRGVRLEDSVFVGPSATFTNILAPRAEFPAPVSQYKTTVVRKGASIGANATILCGIKIGRHSMIGAGALVTEDVRPHALVLGNPAHQAGWVCVCGAKIAEVEQDLASSDLRCSACPRQYVYDVAKQSMKELSDESPTSGSSR